MNQNIFTDRRRGKERRDGGVTVYSVGRNRRRHSERRVHIHRDCSSHWWLHIDYTAPDTRSW